ncbi:MAG: wax ester/triacylglycerol synthase family O-acyltransferase [Gammaproteobacteria bacterium]
MPNLSFYDYAFLVTETADSPKHVAGLQILRPPEDYTGDYVADLVAALSERQPGAPFSMRFHSPMFGMPRWVEDEHFDLSYHLRQTRLPHPGTRQQLMDVVARLHSVLLDRQRPLWEMHVIEGLDDGCFALYSKIHHAYCDGATLVRLMLGTLNRTAEDQSVRASWEPLEKASYHQHDKGLLPRIGQGVDQVRRGAATAVELTGLAARMVMQRLGANAGRLPVPFTAPRTKLNAAVTRARRAAIGQLPMDGVKTLCEQTGTTINDVLVTICDIALTRYLREHDDRPSGPLVAQMPVSLRRDGNEQMGNQIAIMPVTLGRSSHDPLRRLHEVSRSCAEVKEESINMSRDTVSLYTLLIQGVAQAGEFLGMNDALPPLGNILISNVPGPRFPLYLRGSRLISSYPLSAIPPGLAMNITLFSYDGKFDIGLIAGYDAIPDINLLPGYMDEAFAALCAAASRQAQRARKSRGRSRKTSAAGAGRKAGARKPKPGSKRAAASKAKGSDSAGNGAAKKSARSGRKTATRARRPKPDAAANPGKPS